MKRIVLVLLLALATFTLVACDTSTTLSLTSSESTTTSNDTQSTTTTTTTSSDTQTTTTTSETTTTTTSGATPLADLVPAECQEIEIVDGWIPVFCDEFEESFGESIIDPNKWVYEVGTGNWGWGNNEAQYYTYRRSENTKVEDGVLKIIALNESFGGKQYTSTRLRNRNGVEFLYGKIEMRAKIPFGRGTWPAFWMMPRNSVYGGWPRSGEIDIMEHVGYDMNRIHGTIHTERYSGVNGRGGSANILVSQGLIPPIDVVNQFHVYSVIWEEGKITWYFDGHPFYTVGFDPNYARSSYLYPTNVDWPFDQPFYIIMNLAIGGEWGGALGIDNTIFPQTFTIDYVRVYQKDYYTGDQETPSMISNLRTLHKTATTAYLTWNQATDDLRVRNYLIFVNGRLVKTTSLWGIQLTGLTAGDHYIQIFTEDYAGKLSDAFETYITIDAE